jgi:hemerythrin-like domain-containing protein
MNGLPSSADPAVETGREGLDAAAVRQPPRASRDLRREHVHVLRMLKILEAVQVRMAEGEAPPAEVWSDIVSFLRVFVDRCHHGKEERALFPAVMLIADGEAKVRVEELLVEHVEGRRLVAALAAAAGTEPVLPGDPRPERPFDLSGADAAISGYVSLIRPHVIHEEKAVFPLADATLAPEFQETLQGEYDRIEAEVTGLGLHEAFEETVSRLKDLYLPRPRTVAP